ncbi:Globin-like protein 9 [Aphelenchoides bicaudatus]|nr:Globin-like protein 9 [Aphelenchoides bicaudatus]
MWYYRQSTKSPPPPAPNSVLMLHQAMREISKPTIHLCVPRTSRSLSPKPAHKQSMVPLIRCYSDRNDGSPAPRLTRSNSIASSTRSLLTLVPDLTPSQVQLIRKSWRHINTKGLTSVLQRCFLRLESSNQEVALAFRNASSLSANSCGQSAPAVKTVLDHAKFFLALLDRIIDGEPDMDLDLKRIGAKHAFLQETCGIDVHAVERLGELIAEAFVKLDGVAQSKESKKAWRLLIAQIIDHVRDGWETEVRFQKRRTSFQPGAGRRNSMPNSNRKTSLKVDAITRKLSNF